MDDVQPTNIMRIIKITLLLAVAAATNTLSSCASGCCTGEEAAPPLRPLPNFKPLGTVDYAK